MIETSTEVQVRYAETDKMGVVYHGNYFTWFEIGRVRMLDEAGLPYREIEASGYLLPVLEATAQYLRPASFDDRLTIKTFIREMPTVRIKIDYEVWKDDTLLCTGSTRHAFVDENGSPSRPPAHFTERMKAYLS